jgi:hypothetical protein
MLDSIVLRRGKDREDACRSKLIQNKVRMRDFVIKRMR